MGFRERLHTRQGNTVELLPYAALTLLNQAGIMHNRNGTYEVGVEVTVPNSLFTGTHPIINAFRHLLQTSLPAPSRLRTITEVVPMPMGFLDDYKARITATEPRLRHLLEARVQQFEEDWERSHLRAYRTFVTVRLGTPQRTFPGLSPQGLREREQEAQGMLGQLSSSLHRASFKPRHLTSDDSFGLCFRYLNPDFAQSKLGTYRETQQFYPTKAVTKLEGLRPSSLRAQLAKSPINNAGLGHIIVGNHFVRVFALHTTPGKETFAGMMHAAEAAGSHYYVITDIYVEPSQKAIGHITARARQFEAAALTENYFVDPETRVLRRDSNDALEHSYDTGDRFFKMSVGLVLFDENERTLKRRATETYAALSGIPGNPFMPLSHGCLTPFLNFAPLSGREHGQKVTLTTSNATHFMPVTGPWHGSKKAVAKYHNRYFGLTNIDPFDREADAYNGLIIGATGSGKTFLTQDLLSEFLAEGGTQVVIIDRGSGYKPLVEVAEGAVVELNVGGKTSINPFDLEADKTAPSDEDKMMLLNVLRAMIPGEPGATKEIEDAILMAAITQLYSYAYKRVHNTPTFVTPTLSDFVKKLEQLDEVNSFHLQDIHRDLAKNLAMRLQSWLGDTALGSFVDRPTNIPLSSARVVYYDTEGLRNNPQLKAVGTLLISQLVWKRVLARQNQRTLVILDEGWSMIQGNAAGEAFVGEMFRRFRTTGSGIWAISQSYADFANNPGIVNNVQNLLFLKSNADERELWKRSLNLPEGVISLAAQVTSAKAQFSEALYLVRRGEQFEGNIISLHPTPLSHLLFSTNHEDKAKRSALLEQYGTLENAVKQLEVA
ncbi:MAG: VirB4 family type IV secretion system protein [Trueperaceae bacterium]